MRGVQHVVVQRGRLAALPGNARPSAGAQPPSRLQSEAGAQRAQFSPTPTLYKLLATFKDQRTRRAY